MAQRPIYKEDIAGIRRRVAVFYLAHPGARAALRLGLVLAVILAVSWYLLRAGYLTSATLSWAYFAAVAGLAVVISVLSLLGIRGRFTGLILPNDPGHHHLPFLPPGLTPERGFGRLRIPSDTVPGTYAKDSVGDAARRAEFQWPYPPGQRESIRTLQFKFGAVAIHARTRDAKEAKAYARVRVIHATRSSITPGAFCAIGPLNWFLDSWEEHLMADERAEGGNLTSATLNYVYEYPGLGLNKFLYNPEVTIYRGQSHFLPLFYMRDGCPDVFLCGQPQALIAGRSPDEAPVDFDFEVTISALDFRPLTLKLHCTARWDALTVEEGKW